MFTHMEFVRAETHSVDSAVFSLDVYRVRETGQHRVFIARDGDGLGVLATASSETVFDGKQMGDDVVAVLLSTARDEIEANEGGVFY